MRSMLALLIFSISASANATLIQIDTHGSAIQWQFDTPVTTSVSTSVLLDTAGFTGTFDTFVDAGGSACLGSYDTQLGAQILSATADGTPIFSANDGAVRAGGDFPSPNCTAGQQSFFAFLRVAADGVDLLLSYDSTHAVSLDDLIASTDPLATLLLSGRLLGSGSVNLTTPTGSGFFSVDQLYFRDVSTSVPEPATLMLLLLGFSGMLLWGRRPTPAMARGHQSHY